MDADNKYETSAFWISNDNVFIKRIYRFNTGEYFIGEGKNRVNERLTFY